LIRQLLMLFSECYRLSFKQYGDALVLSQISQQILDHFANVVTAYAQDHR